jgi:hypothetical protein
MIDIINDSLFWKERVQILLRKEIRYCESICWKDVYYVLLRFLGDGDLSVYIPGYDKHDHNNAQKFLMNIIINAMILVGI